MIPPQQSIPQTPNIPDLFAHWGYNDVTASALADTAVAGSTVRPPPHEHHQSERLLRRKDARHKLTHQYHAPRMSTQQSSLKHLSPVFNKRPTLQTCSHPVPTAAEQNENNSRGLKVVCLKNGSSQDQNPACARLFVPNSLGSASRGPVGCSLGLGCFVGRLLQHVTSPSTVHAVVPCEDTTLTTLARDGEGSTPTSLPKTLRLYTLHPTPYTPHPTPYTLHPTPYTLHPTPIHPALYILHP